MIQTSSYGAESKSFPEILTLWNNHLIFRTVRDFQPLKTNALTRLLNRQVNCLAYVTEDNEFCLGLDFTG